MVRQSTIWQPAIQSASCNQQQPMVNQSAVFQSATHLANQPRPLVNQLAIFQPATQLTYQQ